MKKHSVHAGPQLKHSLGQNFILDEALQEELAALTGLTEEDNVLEIGAGSGMLTCALARRVGHLTAVELDQEMIPYLKAAVLPYPNVTVVRQDVLKMDWQAFAAEQGPFSVAANLPYHVTTAVLTKWMSLDLPIRSIHLMLQKETTERLCAAPGGEGYGPMTVMIAWRYVAEIRKYVPREAFTPVPGVDSAFLSLVRRDAPPFDGTDESRLFDLIKAAFATRRKTILNNLMNRYHLTREETEAWLDRAGVSADLRAERLSLADFDRLVKSM